MHESLLIALVNAQVSIGFRVRHKPWYVLDRAKVLTKALPAPEPKSEVLANAESVAAFTGIEFSPESEVFPQDADFAFARAAMEDLPSGRRIVGLSFGARDPNRHWPPDLWAKVTEILDHAVRPFS